MKERGNETMTKPITVPPIKPPNYTDAQVEFMTGCYTEQPNKETVEALAIKFGKGKRSIIAKLSNMGIYIAPKRTTKSGKPIVKKETLVDEISACLGVELTSLVKANKQDLERLVIALHDQLDEVVL
jgi:hypothetical protein